MQKGWNASGYLPALLAKRDMTQEQLADAAAVDRGTVNGYCTGRIDLGLKNGRRLAAVLGVSLVELGGPAEAGDERGETILDRLEELATKLADAVAQQKRDHAEVVRLRNQVRKLEALRADAAAAPSTTPAVPTSR